jgi:hypothetical protein
MCNLFVYFSRSAPYSKVVTIINKDKNIFFSLNAKEELKKIQHN